jgi:dipeptidyl-peptidase-4
MSRILSVFFILFFYSSFAQVKQITLKDIWGSAKFSAKTISGFNSLNNGTEYTLIDADKNGSLLEKYDYKTGNKLETILNTGNFKPSDYAEPFFIEEYTFSKDESKLLLAVASEAIYRHSYKSSYFIFDIKNKSYQELVKGEKQQLAQFSPQGDKVAYVQDNNIFIKNLSNNEIIQITKDGKRNEIINGAPDWVYEEEFSFSKAWHWNEDGTQIAFMKFDESKVKEYNMPTYGSLYPDEYRYKYPKAGEENSTVSVWIYNTLTKSSTKVDVGSENNQYIPRIQWTKDPNVIFVAKLNRLQNKLDVIKFNSKTNQSSLIYTESSNTYVDIHEGMGDLFYFTPDNKYYYYMSDKDGFNHLYKFDINGKQLLQVTKGNWEIMEFYGIDEKGLKAYYQSTETGVTNRSIYSIKTDGKDKKAISPISGSSNAQFSNGYKYFINTYSSANNPAIISLHTIDGSLVRTLEDNKELVSTLKEYDLSKKEFFTFKSGQGIELNGWMIKPNGFDPNKKYPVFMTFYGGPGRNMVTNEWGNRDYLWHLMLAQKGYLVVCVDNRGTMGRGAEFKKSTYKQLGKLELEDQMETAKYLGTLSFVDPTRIGCEGWSFGGYLSSLCITKANDLFKMAIAVAPVTNWRYYDTIYTERFLQTPQENASGYDENSPINFVKKLKGKYLLIHGTADDNVHFQNSIEMSAALIKHNIPFDVAYYPDKNHGIYGGATRLHLFTKMTDYIINNL